MVKAEKVRLVVEECKTLSMDGVEIRSDLGTV